MNKTPEFFPNVEDYNSGNYDNQPVTLENLEYLIYKIVARTGLTYDQASLIVRLYFNEIRTQILNGETVNIGNVGKLFIKLQKSKKSKDKISFNLKFKRSKKLINKIRYNAIFR